MSHDPKSLRDLPVEPLSEARWTRIERDLFQALDQPEAAPIARGGNAKRGRWIAAGGLALAAAAALVFAIFFRRPAEPVSTTSPSRFVTGSETSHVVWGQSEIDVLADTAVVASGDDVHGILLVLERGGVACEVAPRAGRPPFVVQAGDTRIRVVGTQFRVERAADGSVRVSVVHGTVEVTRGGTTTLVGTGERWPATAPMAPTTQPAPTAVPAATAAPTAEATVHAAATARPTDRQLYETAARKEVSDPEGAMSTYRALAAGGGPWAANALFAAGRLSAERGRKADAKRLLGDYVTRYPRGPNAEDARRLLAGMK